MQNKYFILKKLLMGIFVSIFPFSFSLIPHSSYFIIMQGFTPAWITQFYNMYLFKLYYKLLFYQLYMLLVNPSYKLKDLKGNKLLLVAASLCYVIWSKIKIN